MIESEKTYRLIDRYLRGLLDDDKRKSFELSMAQDPQLKELVEFEMTIHETVQHASVDDIRNTVTTELQNIKKTKRIQRNLLIGSAIIIIAVSSFFLFDSEKDETAIQIPKNPQKSVVPKPAKSNAEVAVQVDSESKIAEESLKKDVINIIEEEPAEEPIEIVADNPESTDLKEEEAVVEERIIDREDRVKEEAVEPTNDVNDLCTGKAIQLTKSVESPCEGKDNGSITVKAEGGVAPYGYVFSEFDEISTSNKFEYLPEGEYYIIAKDKNECPSDTLTVSLDSKYCAEIVNAFDATENPWIYQEYGKVRTLQIISPAGGVVYESAGERLEWDGNNSNGQPAPTGSYIYLIFENKVLIDKDYITLTR